MKQLLLFFIILLFSISISAKTVIISDIDDTLKISHVKSKIDALFNAFNTHVVFKGMPELLTTLHKSGGKISYISNAPRWLMGYSHHRFLLKNNFPKGSEILRTHENAQNHKLVNIRNILEREEPSTVILIGDNGEHDPKFYHQLTTEFPQIKIYTFIHIAYSLNQKNALYSNQVPFVTALEVTLKLRDLGVLTISQADILAQKIAPQIVKESHTIKRVTEFFPSWLKCFGYSFNVSAESNIINQAIQRINKICLSR